MRARTVWLLIAALLAAYAAYAWSAGAFGVERPRRIEGTPYLLHIDGKPRFVFLTGRYTVYQTPVPLEFLFGKQMGYDDLDEAWAINAETFEVIWRVKLADSASMAGFPKVLAAGDDGVVWIKAEGLWALNGRDGSVITNLSTIRAVNGAETKFDSNGTTTVHDGTRWLLKMEDGSLAAIDLATSKLTPATADRLKLTQPGGDHRIGDAIGAIAYGRYYAMMTDGEAEAFETWRTNPDPARGYKPPEVLLDQGERRLHAATASPDDSAGLPLSQITLGELALVEGSPSLNEGTILLALGVSDFNDAGLALAVGAPDGLLLRSVDGAGINSQARLSRFNLSGQVPWTTLLPVAAMYDKGRYLVGDALVIANNLAYSLLNEDEQQDGQLRDVLVRVDLGTGALTELRYDRLPD